MDSAGLWTSQRTARPQALGNRPKSGRLSTLPTAPAANRVLNTIRTEPERGSKSTTGDGFTEPLRGDIFTGLRHSLAISLAACSALERIQCPVLPGCRSRAGRRVVAQGRGCGLVTEGCGDRGSGLASVESER